MIAVCTTLTYFAMREEGYWKSWLKNAEAIKKSLSNDSVQFFAAIEIDSRENPREPFAELEQALKDLGGEFWYFLLDDHRISVTTDNRLRHITMGQNLASEYSTMVGASHMMFVAADTQLPDDVLPKLLECNEKLVGAYIPTYDLHGTLQESGYDFPVEDMGEGETTSAAAMLVERYAFKRLRWRSDPDEGMSDDPAYCHDVRTLLGFNVVQRMDCIATHYPECIPAIENRHPEEALRIVAG